MTTNKKYTSHQLEQMEENGVETCVKGYPRLKDKYLYNHVHDYTDKEAKTFDHDTECVVYVCGWCSKPKGQHEKTWRNRK